MKNLIKSGSAALLMAAVFFLGSCTEDQVAGNATTIDEGTVKFKVDVPGDIHTRTRALTYADEYAVEDVNILVFTGGNYAYIANGIILSAPTAADNSSDATMTIAASMDTSGQTSDLMVVANATAILSAAYPGGIPSNTPLAEVEKALLMAMPAEGWNNVAGSNGYVPMPMWGYMKDQTIDDAYVVANHEIRLVRMVAKVNIQIADALVDNTDVNNSKFQLRTVRVYNYATKGRLIPDTDGAYDWSNTSAPITGNQVPSLPDNYSDDILSDGENQFIEYTVTNDASNPYKFLENEIYLFEAPAGIAPGSGDYTLNPCLIIGGRFEGSATDTYYRIDYANRGTAGNTYLPILRNNSYSVTVTNITGPGRNTPGEAYHSVPSNIETTILNWSDNTIKAAVTDGLNMLGVSEEIFNLSGNLYDSASGDNELTIVTNYSEGWTAAAYDDEEGTTPSTWLTLSADSGAGSGSGDVIHFEAPALGAEDAARTAYVIVKAGNLSFTIKVTQQNVYIRILDSMGNPISILTFASKNSMLASGEIDIPLAPLSITMNNAAAMQSIHMMNSPVSTRVEDPIGTTNGIPATPQTFTVEWAPADMPLRVINLHATMASDAEFTWQDASTNNLGEIPAGGTFSFTIDPAPFTMANITANPFYRTGTTLMFELEGMDIDPSRITLEQVHYNILVRGLVNGSGPVGTYHSAEVRTNAPWELTITDTASVLDLNEFPADGPANSVGNSYAYNFTGNDGKAVFNFTNANGLFDPYTTSVSSANIADRFAASNIVMIEGDNGVKILTFDETNDGLMSTAIPPTSIEGTAKTTIDIPSYVIGVYFRWGSLMAMSPDGRIASNGTGTSTMELDVNTGDIVYYPAGYTDFPASGTWLFTDTGMAPGEIPYFDLRDEAALTTDDYTLDYFDQKFPGTGYNEAEGRGDICRYISAQQTDGVDWVEGEWRMPTFDELMDLYNETPFTGSLFNGIGMGIPSSTGLFENGPNLYGFQPVISGTLLGAGVKGMDNMMSPTNPASIFLPNSGYPTAGDPSGGVALDMARYWIYGFNSILTSSTPLKVTAQSFGRDDINGVGSIYFLLNIASAQYAMIHQYFATPIRCIRQ